MAEGNKALKWIGMGCGLLFLLAACGIGACVLVIKSSTDAPAGMAHGFFADLRTGNYAAALQRMNGPYQSSHTIQSFQTAVGALPALTQQTDATFMSRSVNNSTATISGNLATPSGDVPVTVTLSEIGGHWYVDSVMVQGQTLL